MPEHVICLAHCAFYFNLCICHRDRFCLVVSFLFCLTLQGIQVLQLPQEYFIQCRFQYDIIKLRLLCTFLPGLVCFILIPVYTQFLHSSIVLSYIILRFPIAPKVCTYLHSVLVVTLLIKGQKTNRTLVLMPLINGIHTVWEQALQCTQVFISIHFLRRGLIGSHIFLISLVTTFPYMK